MARIGILTCSNATQDLGCSSVSCLADIRKRKGKFERYKDEDKLDLVGIINCAGCPTLAAPQKLLDRVRALTEFRVDAIHFSLCIDALCPFKAKFKKIIEEKYPGLEIVMGTHQEHIPHEAFREEIRKTLCQPKRTMVDVIKGT